MAVNIKKAVQGPRAPSAPSAPAVRATLGAQKKNTTAAALGGQNKMQPQNPGQQNKGLQNKKGPQNQNNLGKKGTPLTAKKGGATNNDQQNIEDFVALAPDGSSVAGPPPRPPYAEKPDPRDAQYYENVAALNATFAIQNEQLNAQQTQADNAFALDSAQMDEYNSRRQRSIAEARLGRGLRSGGFRRERNMNDMDYMMDSARRLQDKSNADSDRRFQRSQLESDLTAGTQQAYRDAFNRAAAAMEEESMQSAGDSQDMEGIFNAEDTARTNKNLRGQMGKMTDRIKALREKQKNAGPKQKEHIEKQIKKLQGQRTKIKGKIK